MSGSTRQTFPCRWWVYVLIFCVAFALRVYGMAAVPGPIFDEPMHVPNAFHYTHHGYLAPANWYHPPARHVVLHASIALLGDNAYGWRMPNLIAGAATVLMVFVFARYLFRRPVTAYIATALIMFDPLHILLSRGTTEDVPAALFVLSGLYLGVRGLDERSDAWLVGAGVMFGLAGGLKWYCMLPGIALLVVALVRRRSDTAAMVRSVAYLGLVPLLTYLPWYGPWFRGGNSFAEWIDLHVDTLRVVARMTETSFDPMLGAVAGPWRWFVAPVGVGFETAGTGAWRSFMILMNNPPIWVLVLSALVYMVWRGWKAQRADYLLVGLSALSLYVSFLVVSRPMYVYVAAAIVPLGFLAVAMLAVRVLRRWSYAFLTAVAAMGAFVYPLVAGISVPVAAYEPILRFVEIVVE